jgi:hypothetical protein
MQNVSFMNVHDSDPLTGYSQIERRVRYASQKTKNNKEEGSAETESREAQASEAKGSAETESREAQASETQSDAS